MALQIECEVLIVGAGVAGLVAARTLSRAGVRCLTVDARNYVGGRIRTEHLSGGAVELGAEFVHGRPAQIFNEAEQSGLQIRELERPSWESESGKLKKSEEMGSAADEVFQAIESYDGPDLSFSDFVAQLALTNEVREQATRFVEGFNAANAEEVSVLALKRQQLAEDEIEGDRAFHIAGGYDALAQLLERQLDASFCELKLETRVDAIASKRGSVVSSATAFQHGRSFEFRAKAALITIPLACMQRHTIAFDPPLIEKEAALTRLAMGEVVRVSLHFREAFWREKAPDLGFLFARDEADFPVFWTAQDPTLPVITAWASSRNAERLLELTAAEIGARGLAALGRIFDVAPDVLRNKLLSAHYHDWSSDPYAHGAYSYILTGGRDAPGELAKPLEDTLFFAGEHTESEGHHATVHGAMASGERAAREILAAIRISSSSR